MELVEALRTRRTARQFQTRPVSEALVRELVELACCAPAPHHTQPWRFALIDQPERRAQLARAMGAAWAEDLRRDGLPEVEIEALRGRSARTLARAPALLLGSIVGAGLRTWPDETRAASEWFMVVQSFGAALQNLFLAVHANGLGARWLSWPLFCQTIVRETLGLPADWVPQAFIVIGWTSSGIVAPPRPSMPDGFFLES